MRASDLVRELEKAENVLGMVERYLTAFNESMAALHLSERVIQSPLTAAVMQARMDLTQAVDRLALEGTSPDQVALQVKQQPIYAPGTK